MAAEFEIDLTENLLWLDDRARLGLSTQARDRGLRRLGRHAVVIGAGTGGRAAAGALVQYLERVDILERGRYAECGPDLIGIAFGAFVDPVDPGPTVSVWETTRHPCAAFDHQLDWFAVQPKIDHCDLGQLIHGAANARN